MKLKDLTNPFIELMEFECLRMERSKMTEQRKLQHCSRCDRHTTIPCTIRNCPIYIKYNKIEDDPDYIKAKKHGEEIVNALAKEQSMIPNTREEAIKKVEQATRSMYGAGLVEAFEALGLLKFEEAKTETKSGCFDSGYLTFGNHSVAVEEIIRLMVMKGYTISKRDSDGTAIR